MLEHSIEPPKASKREAHLFPQNHSKLTPCLSPAPGRCLSLLCIAESDAGEAGGGDLAMERHGGVSTRT